ncbi:MAG: sugar phosphate nucleotidyltransferase [Gemmatimonadales bacterium]|nr:sugar phosphate nucleotidyltransferase [Gemmatimonadales bacterium]
MLWAVILAGGSGTRFWPLSTPSRPKQLLPLVGEISTAEASVRRLRGLVPPERTLLVTNAALAPVLAERLGIEAANVLVEPRPASTAPALAWATHEAGRRDPDAMILSLHADWAVADERRFQATARQAADVAARHDRLVLVGMRPDRPETGYGYILPGDALGDEARVVARFTEKPSQGRATRLIEMGALWNSGLFVWTARRLRAELEQHCPEVAGALAPLDAGDVAGFFREVREVTIDEGVLERSARVAVIAGDFGWDDVGTWEALRRVRPRDPAGNVLVGRALAFESRDCIVWSEDVAVVLDGVQDLVVVQANGRVLVTTRERAASLKKMLDALPRDVRDVS